MVAMAAGHAIGRGAPSLALLHSTPGPRERGRRAGDRAHQPRAAGGARGPAGPPPPRARSVPRRPPAGAGGRLPGLERPARAPAGRPRRDRARLPRGGDRPRPGDRRGADGRLARARARAARDRRARCALLRSAGADPAAVDALADLVAEAQAPAIVAGAGADSAGGWAALRALAERLACPVFQEPFGGAAGFPQDHPLFAGHLPARRARLREMLAPYDVVLVVGTGALRQYPFDAGPLVRAGTRMAVVTQDPEEAHRSPVELAVLGDPAAICAALAAAVDARDRRLRRRRCAAPSRRRRPRRASRCAPGMCSPRWPSACRATRSSSRRRPRAAPSCTHASPRTEPLGFVSAMGMLGFALPAAIGLRMARPDRPVLAVVGDGSSLYQIQALWSAARYRAGVLFIVLANGGYAIMDRLAERNGSPGPWPAIDAVDIGAIARAFGLRRRAHRGACGAARAPRYRAGHAGRPRRRRSCSRSPSRPTRRSTVSPVSASASATCGTTNTSPPRPRPAAARRPGRA